MVKYYNGGSVALRSRPADIICEKSIFSSPWRNLRAVGRRRRRLITAVAVLVATPLLVGMIYAGASAQEQQPWAARVPVSADSASVPTRVEESSYLSVVPYETVTVSDPELLKGETRVMTPGRDGVRQITEMLVYEGEELSRVTSVSNTVVVEPVAETIAVGTADAPSTESTGSYIWPADGVVSSWYGKRSDVVGSSNHQGIDIAGERGDSVYAADGGEVILADSSVSGYGLLVQILHDNGEVTYYAHNDELLVEAGERVYQGQEIAKMGSTGVSSGVHVHFEVRVNGSPKNPTKYLP